MIPLAIIPNFLFFLFTTVVGQSNLKIPENNSYQIPEHFEGESVLSLGDYTHYFHDLANQFSAQDILRPEIKNQFESEPKHLHPLETFKGTTWFRFKLIGNKQDKQEYFLNYPSPYVYINAYTLEGDSLVLWDESGFGRNAGNSFFRLGNDNFRLVLQANEEITFFLQCTQAIVPIDYALYKVSLSPLEVAFQEQLMIWWWVRLPLMVFGILIIYHFILFIQLKKRLYLYMCFLLLGFTNGPDAHVILIQLFSKINHFGMNVWEFGCFLWVLLMLGILFFEREVLNLPKHLPKGDLLVKMLIGIILLSFGLSFLNRFTTETGSLYPNAFIGLSIRNFISLTVGVSTIIIAFIRWRQGSPSGLWFFLAMAMPIVAVLANYLYTTTWGTDTYVQFFEIERSLIPNLNFGFMVIFLAISLSERIKDMEREGLESQLNHQLALAESNRLREINTIKSRLYTNITHEFRTPLTVIQGVAAQIQQHPQEKEMIHRNSQQLLELVNQILELSKSETGLLKVHLIYDDIIGFLRYITESFHALANDQKIDLRFQSKEDLLQMDFDPEKVLRILSNLISNAIKFTPENEEVLVNVNIKDKAPSNQLLEIKVRDNGIGIPSDLIAVIFNRFYQVDDSSTRRREGTGIGLALAKELVELMEGEIKVKSEVQKGSTFIVQLPIRHTMTHKKSGNQQLLPQLNAKYPSKNTKHSLLIEEENDKELKPTLLIVEDSQDVMHYIKSCLKDDFTFLSASNGQQGIEIAIEHIPDIIISDIMMPEKDGYELCATLKQDERTDHIPIILLTAKADIDSKLEGLEYGADAYLIKPFNQQELNIRLHKLIELRKKLQQRYQQSTRHENQEATLEHPFLEKVRQAILDQMMMENFSIASLAQSLHFSRQQLYRKLKALTGKSIIQFINETKLNKGKHLLETSEMTISEIAYSVGYTDPAYFTRLFTKHFGKTPSEMREDSKRDA